MSTLWCVCVDLSHQWSYKRLYTSFGYVIPHTACGLQPAYWFLELFKKFNYKRHWIGKFPITAQWSGHLSLSCWGIRREIQRNPTLNTRVANSCTGTIWYQKDVLKLWQCAKCEVMLMTTEDRQYHGENFLLLYIYLITKCWKQLDLQVARRQAWALLEVCPQDCMWPDHAFKLFKDVYELDFVNKAHQFLCNPSSKLHLHQQDSWKTKIRYMWESPQSIIPNLWQASKWMSNLQATMGSTIFTALWTEFLGEMWPIYRTQPALRYTRIPGKYCHPSHLSHLSRTFWATE